MVGCTAAIRCLKNDRDSSSLLRALISTMGSPSRIKEERPRSWTKKMAQTFAKASTSSDVQGRDFLQEGCTN